LVFRRDHGLGGVLRQDVRDRLGHFLPKIAGGARLARKVSPASRDA